MDSANEESISFLKKHNVICKQIADQDNTDFDKALDHIEENFPDISFKFMQKHPDIKGIQIQIFVMGGLGGRLDHAFSKISTIGNFMGKPHPKMIIPNVIMIGEPQITLMDKNSNLCYLRSGKHEIFLNEAFTKKGIGVFPFSGKVFIESKGLKYEMGKIYHVSSIEMGNIISSSNEIIGNSFEIEIDKPVLFTAELKQEEKI